MITIATLLWSANAHSQKFSSMYDETWVERLYQGFARNITGQFRFVVYTDRERSFGWPVEQVRIGNPRPSYADCLQPYEMNEPMILVGLDTIICGNVDHLVDYCLTSDKIALPRDPYHPDVACNGVALVPAGKSFVWTTFNGGCSDMEHMRKHPHNIIDDIWPGEVVSFKGHVKRLGLGDARIVYFHGEEKPHQLSEHPLVQQHWI